MYCIPGCTDWEEWCSGTFNMNDWTVRALEVIRAEVHNATRLKPSPISDRIFQSSKVDQTVLSFKFVCMVNIHPFQLQYAHHKSLHLRCSYM